MSSPHICGGQSKSFWGGWGLQLSFERSCGFQQMSKVLLLLILSEFILFFFCLFFGCVIQSVFVLSEASTVVCLHQTWTPASSFWCCVYCKIYCWRVHIDYDVSEPASEYVISIKAFNSLGNGPSRYETVVTSEDIGMNILLCLCVAPPPPPPPPNLSLCLSQDVGTKMLSSLSPLPSLPLSFLV